MNLVCQQIAEAALGPAVRRSGAELFFRCPNHEDKHPSLQVNTNKNVFLCGPCNKAGNAWRLAAFLARLDPTDKRAVPAWLRERGLLDAGSNGNGNGHHGASRASSSEPKVEFERLAEFYYAPDLRKIRLERPGANGGKREKSFRWEHREGETWKPGDGGLQKPLYANALFRESEQLDLVLAFEGERKADLAGELGFAAFSFKNLTLANCDALAALDVVLWPDADAPGFHQSSDAAKIIHESEQPRRIRTIVPPPELPIAGDIVDGVRSLGWGRNRIEKLIAEAKTFPPEPEPVGCLLDSVVEQKVEWLWERRIPLGALTILDGDPGDGKSVLSNDTAAKVSSGGPLPGQTAKHEPAGVVILTAEDSLAHVVVPRLRVAGADLSRICAIPYAPASPGEQTFSRLPADLPILERAIERVGARLVIFDVLACYIPITLSMQRDQDVRLALAPLAEMADRLQVACLLLRHLNKDTSKSTLYRGGGSIAIVGAARSGLLLAKDPNDPEIRVLAAIKSNFGAHAESLNFRIRSSGNVPFIEWIGTTDQTADQLLAPQTAEERGAVQEAAAFLRQALADGPIETKELYKMAEDLGISRASLKRAKSFTVDSFKTGWRSWQWGLKENFVERSPF